LGEELELPDRALHIFSDLDAAVGWCDDQLLINFDEGNPRGYIMEPEGLLDDLINNKDAVATISKYFERVDVPSGDFLFKQGESGDSLYLILGGAVSIVLDLPGGQSLTVRTMRAGSILGEMAVYTGSPRSASAHARQDCALYRLSVENYNELVASHPIEAGIFSSYIVKLMAERLGRANRSVLALTK